VIVLDTHVLICVTEGSSRLGKRAKRRIEQAFHDGQAGTSAFSFWEIATLMHAGRLRGSRTPEEFRAAVVRAGVVEIPVDGEIAIVSTPSPEAKPARRSKPLRTASPRPSQRRLVRTVFRRPSRETTEPAASRRKRHRGLWRCIGR
jgi:PIN domain nuclease of toxin-antitoxin system